MRAHSAADPYWNERRIAQLRRLHAENLTPPAIAARMGIRRYFAVCDQLRALGLPVGKFEVREARRRKRGRA